MSKKFLKEYWPDIVFAVFMLVSIVFFFIPTFNLVFKDSEGVKTYFGCSLFTFMNGSKRDYYFGPNFVVVAFTLCIIFSFIFYYLALANSSNRKKLSFGLNLTAFILLIISIFALMCLDQYAFTLNEGLKDLANIHGIKPINYSYGIYLLSLVVLALLTLRKLFNELNFTIYDISEIAVLVALALILDKVKIPVGATGGSINAAAVPLFIIGIRFGFVKGIISSSIIFGFISCLFDGYGLQYYPFDYLIAFSGYAFVGLFFQIFMRKTKVITDVTLRNKKELINLIVAILLGGVVSFITRMVGHCASSMVYYGYNFMEAFMYNIVYVSFSIIGAMIIAIILAKPILIIMNKYPLHEKVTIEK